MAIVSYTFYTDSYGGTAIAATDWHSLEAKAETLIDALTGGAIYETLPESIMKAVSNAICAQADYINYEGDSVALMGVTETSYTLGKIRVDGEKAKAESSNFSSMICPAARVYLERTGLLYRGIPVLGDLRGVYI